MDRCSGRGKIWHRIPDREVEKENPADVFRGQIFHGGGAVEPEPVEYEEDPVECEEEPVESEQDPYAYAGSESQLQEEAERETRGR